MLGAIIEVAELFAGVGGFRLGLEGYRSAENPRGVVTKIRT